MNNMIDPAAAATCDHSDPYELRGTTTFAHDGGWSTRCDVCGTIVDSKSGAEIARERAEKLAHIKALKRKGAPAWVKRIVREVCGTRQPVLHWRYSTVRDLRTSGHCYGRRRIVVTCGAESTKQDQKYVLLHELAHWLDYCVNDHDDEWARQYVKLLRRYRMPMRNYEVQRYNSVKRVLRAERRTAAMTL